MSSGETNGMGLWTTAGEYELLVGAVRDYAIFLLAPDGTVRSWNSGAQRIMGYTADEIIGTHFSVFYPRENHESDKCGRELEVAEKEGRVEDEGWRLRKDGGRFWGNNIITVLRDPDGGLHGFVKVTRDLTERKMAEERLRRSEEMFRLLVASVKDYAIFMLNPEGLIMSWNPGAQRIKGYQAEEVFGEHFSIFYTVEDREAGKPRRMLETAERTGVAEDEGWRLRKGGERFWAHVTITAMRDADNELRGFAKMTRDITEKKRAEELKKALLEQREARMRADEERRLAEASSRAAREASRAKDEFLMMLSHELRTPLTSILGWARLLPTLERNDATISEGLRSIARSAELQARLVDDVLDISRIVAGKLRLDLRHIDLSLTMREAAEHVRDQVQTKSLKFDMAIEDDLGIAYVDPVRLHQIVWNLLNNAVKFTPEHGMVTFRVFRSGTRIEIVVSDTGEGIPPEILPHIFDAFRQGDMGVKRGHGGLGLGLTIVRHLVEAHGGTISAESEGVGKGATFRISIPAEPLGAHSPEIVHLPEKRIEGRLEGYRILIVDDDLESRRFLSSVIGRAGAVPTAVPSASEALIVCSKEPPDLILTDIGMPELSGHDLRDLIREAETRRRTPIVAISAFDTGNGRLMAERFDAFLRKPIDPFDLVTSLEAVLE